MAGEDLVTRVRIEILNAFTAPLKQLRTELGSVNTKLGDTKRAFDAFRVAANLNQAAEGLGRFSAGIIGVLKPAANEFISFEAAMSKVSALTGEMAGSEGFAKLKAQAQELGAATAYSATEAADAQAIFGQQGLKTNEILAATPAALNLAAAGMLGIAESAEIMGVAMSGMGIKAEQTGHVVDVLAAAANAANTDVQGMGTAFSYVGPIAAEAKMSLELTAAAIGKLSDAGIKNSAAGTGLRGVLASLLAPSRHAKKAMAEYGFSLEQVKKLQEQVASGKLDEAFRQFAKVGEKLPDARRLELMEKIFGREAETAATVLIKASVDSGEKGLDALVRQLRESDGAAARMASVLQDNLKGELERTGGALSELAIEMGERLKPSILDITGGIQKAAGAAVEWAKENPELANGLVRLVAVAAGGALALKGLLLAGSAAFSTIGILGGAFRGLFATANLMVGAVRGGIAVFQGFQAAVALAGGVIPAVKALTASFAGPAGLVLAAGAAGYAIGTLINDLFGLDDKLAEMIGWITGVDISRDNHRSERGFTEEQEYADGTIINGRTGEVIKVGDGPANLAPGVVKRARAKGLMTAEAINAARAKGQEESDSFARQRDAGLGLRTDGGGFNAVTGIDASAVEENTRVADRGHAKVAKAVNTLTEEVRRRRVWTPASVSPLGDF